MPARHFVKYTLPEGRSGLAPARPRAARRRQTRVRRRLRGLRRRAPAADLLAGRHARRRGPAAAQPGPEPRADPRVPRRAGPERADEVVLDAVFAAGHDQAVGVLRRVPPRGSTRTRQVPLRVPVRQDARLVRAARRRALADHAGAHQGRPRVPLGRPQHQLLVRPRRPGVRGRLRDRRSERLPGPRAAAAHHRVAAPSRCATPPRSPASPARSSGRSGALDGDALSLPPAPSAHAVPARARRARRRPPAAARSARGADPLLGAGDRLGRRRRPSPTPGGATPAITTARWCARSSASRCRSRRRARCTTRLLERFGGAAADAGRRCSPTTPSTLRAAAGLSRAKLSTFLRALAERVVAGTADLEALATALRRRGDRPQLTGVSTGSAPWTAQVFLMLHLERPDVVCAGDLGIRRAIDDAYGLAALPGRRRRDGAGRALAPAPHARLPVAVGVAAAIPA